jgi:hypothetical protein
MRNLLKLNDGTGILSTQNIQHYIQLLYCCDILELGSGISSIPDVMVILP